MSWFGVVNPLAGRRVAELHDEVRSVLEANGVDAELAVSESAEHVADLVTGAREAGATRFVAVGGDGTANLVVNAILAEPWPDPPTLGILPAGTGCDFIRTFGISQDLREAARHLSGPATYDIDVARVVGSFGTRYFLNAADIGVVGATVETAERLPRWLGPLRYRAAFWLTLPGFHAVEIEVAMERRTWSGLANNVVLANGQFFGGGMNVAPKATLVDGVLDVQIFSGPKRQALTLLPRITRGTHLRHKAVRRFRSGSMRVTAATPWPIEVDGEYVGETPVEVSVEPAALRFKI